MGFLDSFKKVVDQLSGNEPETESTPSFINSQQPAPAPAPAPQPAAATTNSGEGLYSEKMERLIQLALADGELTEKEKQVLFKKAEAEGIDLDEFEMVLEARLFEHNSAAASQPAQQQTAAPKSDKFGDIKKCPACGAIVESFKTRCVDCGFEFRNDQANASIQQLFDLLMEVDRKQKGGLSSLFDMDNTVNKKTQIIKNFPIPTSRENIIEFLIQAVPLSKHGGFFSNDGPDEVQIAKAWKAKCEQVMMKAKFAMSDDKALLAEIEKYAKELKIKL
jgi:hypothetical protein